MRTSTSALSAVLVMAIIVLLMPSPAEAGMDNESEVDGSWTRFISKGDAFENCDTDPNGLTSYLDYQYVRINGTVQTGTHRNLADAGGCTVFDHNFGEGRLVWFRSCEDEFLYPDDCDQWRNGVA